MSRLGCSTTLMSVKKKWRWFTGSTTGTPKDAVKLWQGVSLPDLQRVGDQHVPPRQALETESAGERMRDES